jgi:L-threonylcarbamoyladenylate synthase
MRESIPASGPWENDRGRGGERREIGSVSKVKTVRLKVDGSALDSLASKAALRQAAEILKAGGTVAFPTETVYGLGANALDARAVRKIFEAKQRPAWDPIIVHVTNAEQLRRVVERIPAKAQELMDRFWPGPLTLLLPKSAQLPEIVTAGRPKVGVRMPSDPVACRLIELAQIPIAAPSANSFGRTSPTRAEFVLEDLEGRIDAVIDSGQSALGLESTVVDVCDQPPMLYRPGIVTYEQLRSACPGLMRYRPPEGACHEPTSEPSPGTGLKHYAPRARLLLLEPDRAGGIFALAHELEAGGERVGVMLPEGLAASPENQYSVPSRSIYHWGKWLDREQLAQRLFAGLRELDAAGVTVILCPLPEEAGVGASIRDRLLKAARKS